MAYPKTSITISFGTNVIDGNGETAGGFLSAEVLPEDNGGKTAFDFGDRVIYRLYKSSNVSIYDVIVSDGSEYQLPGVFPGVITGEVITFSGSNVANTAKYISNLLTAERLSNVSLGVISKNDSSSVKCSKVSMGEADPIIGVYKISYNTQYYKRCLYNVQEPSGFGVGDFTSYPVLVYIIGVTT